MSPPGIDGDQVAHWRYLRFSNAKSSCFMSGHGNFRRFYLVLLQSRRLDEAVTVC
jgi:hypothetical protein